MSDRLSNLENQYNSIVTRISLLENNMLSVIHNASHEQPVQMNTHDMHSLQTSSTSKSDDVQIISSTMNSKPSKPNVTEARQRRVIY